MDTVFAVAVALWAVPAGGFVPPPPHLHLPLPPLPLPVAPPAEPRPQKHFPGSVCPADTTCVRQEQCSRQCQVGWQSLGLSSCYLPGIPAGAAQPAARADCVSRGGRLPLLEDPEEVAQLAAQGSQWTDAGWDLTAAVWVWAASGEQVDFAALGTAAPPDGSVTAACLLLTPGPAGTAIFQPAACTDAEPYVCETGSSSLSRCARKKDRLCCAVTANHYGEPCYVDEVGTRCEQRIREGYFPVGEQLVRPTEGAPVHQLPWAEARDRCRADGGDLLTVDSKQMAQAIQSMLSALGRQGAQSFYIGLSSNAFGEYSYVNGTPAETASILANFADPADATKADSCVHQSADTGGWSAGDCALPRDSVCLLGPVRHSLRREPAAPRCGVRHTQGVLGKSLFLPPPLLPPLGVPDDGRRGAAQFGEIPWQAAVWTRSSQADHQFSCSGALVHSAWVLTSAECVSGADPADLKVTVGDWDLDETQPVNLPPVALDVAAIRSSPGRVWAGPFGPVLEPGRLAMLRITPELDGGEYPHVGPVCLPDAAVLRRLDQLRCVVTGWRGGAQPTHQPWRPQPQPDLRDILRKFETGVRHDPECQDVAHHLKLLKQRPVFPPPFPPLPVPFSADGLEPRGQYAAFGPPFFGPPLPPPPPPQAAEQPALYVCPRDLRCIPDSGALLACALPPPPPPPPPHFRPGPPPHPLPLYRSSQNDTEPSEPAAAPAAGTPADAYEQLSKGFRPPVDKKQTETRARRSADAEGAASPAAASEEDEAAVEGRSAFFLPHDIIAPHPVFAGHQHPAPHQEDLLEPELPLGVQPAPASTQHYDAYMLVGIASALTAGCSRGQMIFDDVIQEAEFVQQVLHRGG